MNIRLVVGISSSTSGTADLTDGWQGTSSPESDALRLIVRRLGLRLLAALSFFAISPPAFSQTVISTVAGTTWHFPAGANNSQATGAPLGFVSAVTTDSSGNLYVADPGNDLIFKISVSGTLTVVAGTGTFGYSGDGGPATSAALSGPQGLALDSGGNLYIADTFNNRIRMVTAATGIITTVAGNGLFLGGFSGDGGPATNASLSNPQGVTLDSAGNLYIGDTGNGRIRKVAAGTGIITTVAGIGNFGFSGDGGLAINASLSNPHGVALDSAGNLYIADTSNSRIRMVAAANGVITTVAGNGFFLGGFSGDGGPASNALLNNPQGVAVDSAGNLYIADTFSNRVRMVTAATGTITTVVGNGVFGYSGDGGQATSAALAGPTGVAVDSSGNFFIADSANQRVRKVTSGTISTFAGNGAFKFGGDNGPSTSAFLNSPQGVAVDSSGNLYIADTSNQRIRKVAAATGVIATVAGNGNIGFSGDGGPATGAALANLQGVAVDSAGNLYIADTGNARIRKVAAATGIITTLAGGTFGFSGDGGPATAASLSPPQGVAVDSSGNLYIADTNNQRIRKVTAATGFITTVAGNGNFGFSGDSGPATGAALANPQGVAVDSAGNLYIADTSNQRIRKVAAGTGIITTVAGNANFGYNGDGILAINASLGNPTGVAADPSGNLYIADSNDQRIREVSAATGIITTIAGNGTVGYSGDGGVATSAQLNSPHAVVDTAGNLYIADQYNDRIRKVAFTAPTVTVNLAAGQANTTSTLPINFTVVFSEPVTGFAAVDVILNGTALGNKTVTVTGSGTNYNVAIGGLTTSGTVNATIQAGAATGTLSGLTNQASTSVENTVTYILLAGGAVGSVSAQAVSGAPGAVVQIPLTLSLNTGASLDSLIFTVTLTPAGGAPALTAGKLSFTPANGISAPSLSSADPSDIVLAWSSNLASAVPYTVSGTVLLGTVGVTIPAGLLNGQSYTIQVTKVSGDLTAANGSLAAVTLVAGPNVILAVANCSYLVGDVYPIGTTATTNTCGTFGANQLDLESLIVTLRVVMSVPGWSVQLCTDLFDAMDSYPADTNAALGGDGQLTMSDLIQTLRRLGGVDQTSFRRPAQSFQRWTTCGGRIVPALGIQALSPQMGEERQQARLWSGDNPGLSGPREAEASLELGVAESAGGAIRVPVYLHARHDLTLSGLGIGIGSSSGSMTSALRFTRGEVSPSFLDKQIPNRVTAAWLGSLKAAAGQGVLLGYVEWDSATGIAPDDLHVYKAEAAGEDAAPLRLEFPGRALQ